VLRFPQGQLQWSVQLGSGVPWADWRPDGRSLAVGDTYSRDIQIFDAVKPTLLARLVGHTHDPARFVFHPNGQWLLSIGVDNVLRFWDARSGHELLNARVNGLHALQFSKDGQRFAASAGPREVGFYELTAPLGFKEYPTRGTIPYRSYNLEASPSGRFLISGAGDGFRIWDTQAQREALFISKPSELKYNSAHHVFFGADDGEIIYSRRYDGTYRRGFSWHEGEANHPAIVKVGPEITTPVPQNTFLTSVGADRRQWLVRGASNEPSASIVLPYGRMEGSRVVSRAQRAQTMELSSDGRWSCAVCDEERRRLEIWDARTVSALTNMGDLYVLTASFSPDSMWLVGASDKGHHIWRTGSWNEVFFYPSPDLKLGSISFAANSRRVALFEPDDAILIASLPEGKELLRLKPPFPVMATGIALSADGDRLWMLGVGHRVYEWDLTVLRQELAKLGLNWQD
jgi:WD40 repeat protein